MCSIHFSLKKMVSGTLFSFFFHTNQRLRIKRNCFSFQRTTWNPIQILNFGTLNKPSQILNHQKIQMWWQLSNKPFQPQWAQFTNNLLFLRKPILTRKSKCFWWLFKLWNLKKSTVEKMFVCLYYLDYDFFYYFIYVIMNIS